MDPRTRLITTAVTLLTEEGVEAVTLRRIARAAGLSHGAPLRHFACRAELLSAVAAEGFADLRKRSAKSPGTDPRERLRTACRRYLEFALDNPAMFELMFRHDLTGAAELADLFEGLLALFTELVTQAQVSGWRADADPRAVAASLWGATHGLAALWSRGGPADSPDLDRTFEVTLATYLG